MHASRATRVAAIPAAKRRGLPRQERRGTASGVAPYLDGRCCPWILQRLLHFVLASHASRSGAVPAALAAWGRAVTNAMRDGAAYNVNF
jgi:hypothetical protein